MKRFTGLILYLVLFCVVFSGNAVAELAPKAGDAVYRDILNCKNPLGPIGHAGLYIGGGEVIHMQGSGCRKDNFMDTFYNRFWGAIFQGDSKIAELRVKAAKKIYASGPKFSFWNYKGPDKFRCDGMVEKIFDDTGNSIVDDYCAFFLNPRKQWRSWNNRYNSVTSLGTSRFAEYEMTWSNYYLWSYLVFL